MHNTLICNLQYTQYFNDAPAWGMILLHRNTTGVMAKNAVCFLPQVVIFTLLTNSFWGFVYATPLSFSGFSCDLGWTKNVHQLRASYSVILPSWVIQVFQTQ